MQVTAQTLLEAYILDYLRQVGCEDLACKAGARWTNAASVPVPRTRNGILLDWWVRFWKHETRRQRELAAQVDRCDVGRQAQASSPGPPSSQSQLEQRAAECPAICTHDPASPRPDEQHSVSHGICSPAPRHPSLRVNSGQTSLHDTGGWSPLAPGGASWGTGHGSATHDGRGPAAAFDQAAGPAVPTQRSGPQATALVLSTRNAADQSPRSAEAPCLAGAEVEGHSKQLRTSQQAVEGRGGPGAGHAQQAQQQPLGNTLSALWEDEVLDSQPRQPGVHPSGKPGSVGAAQTPQQGRGCANEGSNSCWPSDSDEPGQQRLEVGTGALLVCREARGKPGLAGGSRDAAAELRRPQQQHTPPRLHDLPSPGRRAPPADAKCHGDRDCESEGGAGATQQALLLRQRSARPRPQPGTYARLAQERMRTNAPRGRGLGAARGRGRPPAEGMATAQQQRRRQHLLAQRRQAHAAQHAQHMQQAVLAGGGGDLLWRQQQQLLPAGVEHPAKGSMEGTGVAQGDLPDLPDIPEDLLTLGDPACFDQLFASSGQDDLVGVGGIVGWEMVGPAAGACGPTTSGMAAGTAPAAAAAQGPLTEEDLRGVFDDPLDMLLPLPGGGPGSLHW